MRKAPARICLAVFGAFLSACAGTGTATPPGTPAVSAPNASQMRTVRQPQYELRDANGSIVPGTHIMPTRNSAAAIRVSPNIVSPLNLIYHAGPVENDPKVYIVFWNFRTDPSKEASRLTNFFKGVGGSAWLHTIWQYYSHVGGYIKTPTGQLAGTWSDPLGAPAAPTATQVQNEAIRAAAHHGDYSSNITYFVAMPTGHDMSGFGTDFCAYHSSVKTAKGTIAFAALPYQTDAGAACGSYSVNTTSIGLLDGVSIVGGHELAEAQTDPIPLTGWLDSDDEEAADKCAWENLRNNAFSTGSFPTQPLWNNGTASCVQ